MNFHEEVQKRIQVQNKIIANLVDEHYQASHHAESLQKRMAEIDKLIANAEAKIMECDQAQRLFNSYLAIKEGAVTLDDIKSGIIAAGDGGQNATD